MFVCKKSQEPQGNGGYGWFTVLCVLRHGSIPTQNLGDRYKQIALPSRFPLCNRKPASSNSHTILSTRVRVSMSKMLIFSQHSRISARCSQVHLVIFPWDFGNIQSFLSTRWIRLAWKIGWKRILNNKKKWKQHLEFLKRPK